MASSSDSSSVAVKRRRVEPSDVKHLPKPVSSGREGTTSYTRLLSCLLEGRKVLGEAGGTETLETELVCTEGEEEENSDYND